MLPLAIEDQDQGLPRVWLALISKCPQVQDSVRLSEEIRAACCVIAHCDQVCYPLVWDQGGLMYEALDLGLQVHILMSEVGTPLAILHKLLIRMKRNRQRRTGPIKLTQEMTLVRIIWPCQITGDFRPGRIHTQNEWVRILWLILLHFMLYCIFWCFALSYFIFCIPLFIRMYSACRSVLLTCIHALICTRVYTRSTCPFRLHRASVRSQPIIYLFFIVCESCVIKVYERFLGMFMYPVLDKQSNSVNPWRVTLLCTFKEANIIQLIKMFHVRYRGETSRSPTRIGDHFFVIVNWQVSLLFNPISVY